MLYLYRFFCGVLEVEVSGVYPEKMLNLCAKNRIVVWNSRFRGQKIRLFITVKDFKKLRKILRNSGIRVHILSKSGFPFFIKRYKKRFGIFFGIIIFFAVLQFMSGFIWIVDVNGNKSVSENQILSVCEELGVKIGAKRKGIDTRNLAQELLLKTDNLSWASLNIEGCKLTVNVTEIKPKAEDNAIATNLKAKCDGVIKRIDVTSGNCVVKVGDTVKKGDILVSGIIENASETKMVHSIGSIVANTEETLTLSEPFVKEFEYPLGKSVKKSVLEIFTLKIPLYLGSEKGEYDTILKKKNLKLFSQSLPINLYTKKFIFTKKHQQKRNYDQLCELLEERLLLESEKQNFAIKSKDFTYNETQVTLNAVISKTQDITYSENIIFDIGK